MCCIAKGKNLCYNLIRKRAWHQVNKWCIRPWVRNYKASAKVILRLSGIFFAASTHVETIVLLSKLDSKKYISVELPMDDMDLTSAESKATYKQIQNYVLEKFGFKVSTLYIAQVKKKHGLEVREHYNISKNENQKVPQCSIEKEEAILDALKHFKMLYY